ncbi:alpha/beta hydrolase [Tomitella biformata]|uniref:alpha/beta hydrolase n=1 Tax=Tomitella biformata TaxID=630403 RepID=UPI0005701A5F|nr:alpha/beta hydrolase [Tomitella biformata]
MNRSHPPTTACVLVLPGGKPRSAGRSRPWQLSNLRMAWLARALRARLAGRGIAVERVQYRVRGWNEPERDPVRDAAAVLADATGRFGDVPVVLVGHSMGGRVAAHLADHPSVCGIAALAPWWPESDAARIPAGRTLSVAHGAEDRWTDPLASRAQTVRARGRGVNATWVSLTGAGHFLLTKPRWWHQVAADLVLASLAADTESEPAMWESERCHG